MAHCIFCPNDLGGDTKREHVLLDALGGRKKTKRAVCSACNNDFGATIDKALAAQFVHLRSMFHLKSGSGRNPPGVKVTDIEGRQLLVRPDGTLEHLEKPFTVERQSDRTWRLQINAKSQEHLSRLMPDIAASMGMTLERLQEQLENVAGTETFQKAGIVNLNLQFGEQDALRSVVKQCMTLWAAKLGNDELQSEVYDNAREFVTRGGDGRIQDPTCPDYRDLPDFDTLVEEFGPIHSSILVCSDAGGRVVANFNVYSAIGWHIVLATKGGSPNKKAFLVSNSLDTANWSDKESWAQKGDVAWLDTIDRTIDRTIDEAAVLRRLTRLMSHYERLSNERELRRIFKEAWKKLDLREGEIIPQSALKSLSTEVAERFSHHLLNLPLRRPIKII